MKIIPRNTAKRDISSRITSPEFRKNDATGERQLLLSYADERSNHCHRVTDRDLFLYAAGTNEEGDLPDGLDRLADHKFVVHLDEDDVAFGLDIIPSRLYRSKVILTSQIDIDTVKLRWELEGRVCVAIQRPSGVKPEVMFALIKEIDAMALRKVDFAVGSRIANIAKVVALIGTDTLEIKINSAKGLGTPMYTLPEV